MTQLTRLKRLPRRLPNRLATIALLFGASALPALAASSASSAASDSITTSVGSLSGSIEKSSASSTGDKKVADGDYRIIDVADADRPGMVRMRLQPVADARTEGEFFLVLPQQVLAESRLAQGGIVTARQKAYGTEFTDGRTRQAFFLVLADEWFKELQTTPVAL